MSKFIDLTGQRFGRLTVIERTVSTNKNAKWRCECDCGNIVSVFGMDLKSEKTKSCGCIHSQQLAKRNYKHGLSYTRQINIWRAMKNRCYNSKSEAYHNYGGRGITVCDEWLHDFKTFYDWAMANGYRDDLTIDRIDVNGNYEPSNCRWVNREQQANNQRGNHLVTYKGETHTIAEWARIKHINYGVLRQRLFRGWNIEKALNTP